MNERYTSSSSDIHRITGGMHAPPHLLRTKCKIFGCGQHFTHILEAVLDLDLCQDLFLETYEHLSSSHYYDTLQDGNTQQYW